MNLIDIITFKWLRDLFSGPRMRWVRKYWPYAVAAAEAITDVDWNHDGMVAGRTKLVLLLNLAPPPVRAWLAERGLYTMDGTLYHVNLSAVEQMIAPHLKQTLGVVSLVIKLATAGVSLPGWGIVETAMQMVYEQGQKAAKIGP